MPGKMIEIERRFFTQTRVDRLAGSSCCSHEGGRGTRETRINSVPSSMLCPDVPR